MMSGSRSRAGCHGQALAAVVAVALLLAAGAADAWPRLKGKQVHHSHVASAATAAEPARLLQSDTEVHFQVIGDWGRQGQWNQSDVADVMEAVARQAPPEFVISVGDNFYPSGLTSVDDANFAHSFADVYHHRELQVPWYAVLGNHDYGDGIAPGDPPPACREGEPLWRCSAGPLTQLAAEVRQRDSRWHCRRSRVLSLADGALDIFMYDTTPFVQYYYDRDWASNPGGVREQSWMSELAELEASLSESRAGWKLVVGHHPCRSNGIEHGDTPELRRWVEPLLAKYGVQLYLAGHDHDLEHIKVPGEVTHHIVSGAGSQVRPEFSGTRDALFQQGAQGFVAISVLRDALTAAFCSLERKQPVYTVTIPRDAAESLLLCGDASDPEACAMAAKTAAADALHQGVASGDMDGLGGDLEGAGWAGIPEIEVSVEAEEAEAAAALQAELSKAAAEAAAAFLA